MMHSSIQLNVTLSVLALILLLRNDVNNNLNYRETTYFFCHGFTPTTTRTSFPTTTSTAYHQLGVRRMTLVQPPQSSSFNTDIHDGNKHDWEMDATTKTASTTTTSATTASSLSRRNLMAKMMMMMTTTVMIHSSTTTTLPAFASGGATAGRYTTIPIAKRRYYGRVQQAVHEFLEMGPLIVKGDMSNPIISTFFDVNGVVVVPAKRKDVNGQCTKKDNECKGREIRDSRWNDMKASMYLLGNAFRTDQQKPPDRLRTWTFGHHFLIRCHSPFLQSHFLSFPLCPAKQTKATVKAARAFFKEMNEMEKIVKSNSSKKMSASNADMIQKIYTNALVVLDVYLDLVELPPTDSGHYDQEFDTLVGETARIT